MTLIQRQFPSSPSLPTQIQVKTEDDVGGSAGAITQPQHHSTTVARLIAELESEANNLPATMLKSANVSEGGSNMKNDQTHPFITETADLANGGI